MTLLWQDLRESLRRWRLWGALGWHDILMRYRNTMLGPFWLTLSLGIFVVTLGILYSTLLNQELRGYLQYIAIGLITWTYISTSVLDGCNAFTDSESIIKQIYKPLPVFVLRAVWRNMIIFLHNLPIVALSMLVFLMPLSPVSLLSLIGLALMVLTSVWVGLVAGFFATRFRDIIPIVMSLLQILFFATPVFWKPDMFTGARRLLIDLNPLYHYIELVRAPILGQIPSPLSYMVVAGFTLAGWIFTTIFYARYRNRLVYWI